MNTIEILYYFSTCFYLVNEIKWLFQSSIMINRHKVYSNFKEFIDHFNNLNYEEMNIIKRDYIHYVILNFYILFWFIAGPFTFQWGFFLIQLIICTLVSWIDKLDFFDKNPRNYMLLHWINSLIGALFCIFVILNRYIFHINL